ncbi:MAG: ABC transporter substrate-binding protein [Myxococcales bacterium]|nr:ABC transporter substrate-binding protein [Myxococcales bacterium]MCB9648227.1 ABC transporter substrate-binding protein [Deltaproteobacteria bacterium]
MRPLLLAAGLLALVACRAPEAGSAPLKIGSYGPLSGPAASWGVMLRGMEAYIDFVNANGGVHGRKLAFVYRDDQYNAAKTPLAVRDLVEREGVFAMVGGIGTANGRAVADYLAERKVPFFTPASGAAIFTDPPRENIYSVYPRYDTEGRIIGRHLAGTLGLKRVAVLHQSDDFGAQGAAGLAEGLASAGGELVLKVACQASDTDVSGQVSRVVEAAPEALVIFTAPRPAVLAVQRLHALGNKPQIVTSFVLSDAVMFQLAGADVWEGTLTTSARVLANSDDPAAVQYRDVLKRHAPDLPVGNFTVSGFAFAQPFVEALDRAGPDPTPEKVYAALRTFHDWAGGGPYWKGDGVNPPLTFSDTRHLGHDRLFFAQAENGRWRRVTAWLSEDSEPTTPNKE